MMKGDTEELKPAGADDKYHHQQTNHHPALDPWDQALMNQLIQKNSSMRQVIPALADLKTLNAKAGFDTTGFACPSLWEPPT